MRRRYVFGVDAGGSKTKVVLGEVVDGSLRTIGEAVGSAGNPRSVGFDVALNTIGETIQKAYVNAGAEFKAAESVCFSVAGAGRPDERRRVLEWCVRKGIATKAVIVGDAECLLAAVPGDSSGIALIAGTGSMAWGCNVSGDSARAGGCGYLFDDEGSGYWIAAKALRHICGAADARRTSTSLVAAVLDHLRLSNPQELIGWCYEATDPRSQVASLAPIVFDHYARDPITQEIVNSGAVALGGLVVAVARELEFKKHGFTLACAGSVLLNQPHYRGLLEAELERQDVSPREICCVDVPAVGALNIAWRSL